MASSWQEWYAEEYKSMLIVAGCVIVLIGRLGEREQKVAEERRRKQYESITTVCIPSSVDLCRMFRSDG
jgi:hypothetical protein